MEKVRVWEDGNRVVGVAFFETVPEDVFLNVHPDYRWIETEMLTYAQESLHGKNAEGHAISRIYASEMDEEMIDSADSAGYARLPKLDRTMCSLEVPRPFPPVPVAEGVILKSLAEEDDLRKMHRVLWRGFNHLGEPPEDGIEGRRRMQSGPHYRKDLAIVAQNSAGDFVSICGMWYDEMNRFGYVEPVATDPDYRRLGLGKAVVLEGIRRCSLLGADTAYVWTDTPFYRAIGFQKSYTHLCYEKRLASAL